MKFPILYNKDSKGTIRTWQMEILAGSHRVESGQIDGKKVISDWKICNPKNIGKKNETNADQQAVLEVEALYRKRKDRGWGEELPTNTFVKSFQPMLANKYEDAFKDRFPCYSQPKLDGFRCIAKKDGLWTRRGKKFDVPHVWNGIKHLFNDHPDLIIDGELYSHELRHDFNKIASLVKKNKPETSKYIKYHVYDIIVNYPNDDQYSYRYANTFLIEGIECCVRVKTDVAKDQDALDSYYSDILRDGYEGQMIRFDTPYEEKRTNNLLKRKGFETEEYDVEDIVEGVGNWSGKAKSILLKDAKNDKLFSASIRGSMEYLTEVYRDKNLYIKKPATVRFQNFTPDGVPRFGVVIELDVDDK